MLTMFFFKFSYLKHIQRYMKYILVFELRMWVALLLYLSMQKSLVYLYHFCNTCDPLDTTRSLTRHVKLVPRLSVYLASLRSGKNWPQLIIISTPPKTIEKLKFNFGICPKSHTALVLSGSFRVAIYLLQSFLKGSRTEKGQDWVLSSDRSCDKCLPRCYLTIYL